MEKITFLRYSICLIMIYLFYQISVCPSCDLKCFIQGYTAKLNNE